MTYEDLAVRLRGYKMSAHEKRAQAISWTVGQLQCSTNHRWADEWALALFVAKEYDRKHP